MAETTDELRGAILSDCGQFRYLLTRRWVPEGPTLPFVMLNPSVADGERDDPTIRKCRGFAERLGYGGFVVANLYAYRSTDPNGLRKAGWPKGPLNDDYIATAAEMGNGRVICAWGVNARGMARPGVVIDMLRAGGFIPMALGRSADGIPLHPLMLPYSNKPVPL